MFKFILARSGEIPLSRFYIATTTINQSVYRCEELAGGNSHFIDHLPKGELIQSYQNKKAPILPGWFETCSLSASKVETMYCNDEIPGKEFVMNISMIVLFNVPTHHFQSRDRLMQKVNLSMQRISTKGCH